MDGIAFISELLNSDTFYLSSSQVGGEETYTLKVRDHVELITTIGYLEIITTMKGRRPKRNLDVYSTFLHNGGGLLDH